MKIEENRHEQRILNTWQKNVNAWTDAVRHGLIESRRLITDQAIVEAILNSCPQTVLDLGCGEGWLARKLSSTGVAVSGVDAIAPMIEQARQKGGADFRVVSYQDIVAKRFQKSFDVVACNFALLGKESVENLFGAIPALLNTGGHFVFQTLHPVSACGEQPYRDGWREGSWSGCGDGFIEPAPWFFRTMESWHVLIQSSGMRLCAVQEPLHPKTGKPASVIFIARQATA